MLDELKRKLDERLITGEEFSICLQQILAKNFQNSVKVQFVLTDKDGENYYYGVEGVGDSTESKIENLADGFKVRVNIWQEQKNVDENECIDLFNSYWNKEYCDSVCGLPTTQNEEYELKCNATLKEWQKEKKLIAFIMLDLDHFKSINDNHDHNTGTRVISEFSRVLFKELNGRGILIHQSGDEFNIIFSYDDYLQTVNIMYSIYKAVNAHTFIDDSKDELTMSIGGWLVSEAEEAIYSKIRVLAENAYLPKQKNIQKQRNSIRFQKHNNNIQYENIDKLKTALVRVIGNSNNTHLFHNVFLDYISNCIAAKLDVNFIQEEVNSFLQWVNPAWNQSIRSVISSEEWDVEASMSYEEVGLAVLHGLLKNVNLQAKKLIFKIEKNTLNILWGEGDGVLLQFNSVNSKEGIVWETSGCGYIPNSIDVRKIVLIHAGYANNHEIPDDIFYKVINVDARPTIGGGLPDFWAAALAALMTYMKTNENFDTIAIYGDVTNIDKVKTFLEDIENWDEDQIKGIMKKTFKSYIDIQLFKNKFTGHIYTFGTVTELIDKYFEIYQNLKYVDSGNAEINDRQKRFMKRKLSFNDISLDKIDGCRINTNAQAFPTVLEILRNSNESPMIDQAGREFLELCDFKIVLNTPCIDKVPLYYCYEEQDLDEYFEKTFRDKKSLFRKELEKNNQLNNMISYVKNIVKGENRYATRRAILVVPNESTDVGNYSPLGLVSIWLAPRFNSQGLRIDYSYTWRTVEAIVGLPLSLYSSIRFAEYLTELIKNDIGECNCEVEMGKITYLAHSLHMFTDEENMNIVRGIINEVSL